MLHLNPANLSNSRNVPQRLLELPNLRLWQAKWFLFWCTTRGCGKPSLSFSTGPKLPDAPSKRFKPFKPFKPFDAKPKWFLFFCQTAAAKLAAVASQVFLFQLARNCRMLHPHPANPSNPSKHATPALGAAKFEAVASQVVPFLVQN